MRHSEILGTKILKIEDSKQKSTGLILTTDNGVRIFEWVPKDRFKDIFRNPKGDSDVDINRKWEEASKRDTKFINLLKQDNYSVDYLERRGVIISIDDIPRYYIFGITTKSGVKITKNNICKLLFRDKWEERKYEIDLLSGEMTMIGRI